MSQWQPGERIEKRWEVEQLLEGGCGVVYIVFDHEFRRQLAVKTFKDVSTVEIDQAAFIREATAWIRLDRHPSVVQAFFVLHISGRPHLFLEYISGGNLRQWMDSVMGRTRFQEGLRLGVEICDGLAHIYGRGIAAHRDLKPENCLLSVEGHLKVTDFGLASIQRADWKTAENGLQTQPGGTPAYMPPEQFFAGSVDASADVYAFGVLLYEILVGHHPFEDWFHVADDPWKWAHVQQTVAPNIARSGLQVPIQTLLGRCLAKDPKTRYQSFAPIREILANEYRTITRLALPMPTSMELDSTELELKAVGLLEMNLPGEAAECLIGVLDRDESQDELYQSYGRVLSLLHFCEFQNPGWRSGIGAILLAGLAPGRTFIREPVSGLNEALEFLESIIEAKPGNSSALEMKARLLLIAGRYNSARAAFRDAIASKPEDAAWRLKIIALPIQHSRFFIHEKVRDQPDSELNIAECYRLAAELGNPQAQYHLGLMYMTGRGVGRAPVHAFVWLVLAARQGESGSEAALKEVYEFLQKNEYFQVDARRPSALAQANHNVGVAYYFGNGVEQDYVEAAKWFKDAAEMGLADSRYNLGLMYAEGQGVQKNLTMAYFWLHWAALQEDKNASAMRDSIAADMSSAQIAEASALIEKRR